MLTRSRTDRRDVSAHRGEATRPQGEKAAACKPGEKPQDKPTLPAASPQTPQPPELRNNKQVKPPSVWSFTAATETKTIQKRSRP